MAEEKKGGYACAFKIMVVIVVMALRCTRENGNALRQKTFSDLVAPHRMSVSRVCHRIPQTE